MTRIIDTDWFGEVCSTEPAPILTQASSPDDTIFYVYRGPVRVTDLVSVCVTDNDATAVLLKWHYAFGSITKGDFTGSVSLANRLAGTVIHCPFTTLTTAPVVVAPTVLSTNFYLYGPTAATGGGVTLGVGPVWVVNTVGVTTGLWRHFMRYLPIGAGASVMAGFNPLIEDEVDRYA